MTGVSLLLKPPARSLLPAAAAAGGRCQTLFRRYKTRLVVRVRTPYLTLVAAEPALCSQTCVPVCDPAQLMMRL